MGRACTILIYMERDCGKSAAKFLLGPEAADPTSLKFVCASGCSSIHLTESMTDSHQHTKSDIYYCNKDLNLHCETLDILQCGCFYYPDIGSSEAKQLLKPCAVGSYIVRNSSDPKYLYTISVKTKRGPTSIRICYEYGRFSLDADERSKSQMPQFDSLLHLIDFYVRCSDKRADQCRFLDRNGKKDLPIVLKEPKRNDVPSLRHLSRTLINRSIPSKKSSELATAVEKLPLPKPLKNYINDYPFLH
ncbi:JAK pathway signal transduction adaptor [Mactra antiquata]